MLDKRSLFLLNAINAQCLDSGYRVFDLKELLCYMPEHFGMQLEELINCVKALAEREYVSVKYLDDVEVCLCPLPKGRLVFENRIDGQIERSRLDKKAFSHAFWGGFIGAIIPTVILLLLIWLGGANAQ